MENVPEFTSTPNDPTVKLSAVSVRIPVADPTPNTASWLTRGSVDKFQFPDDSRLPEDGPVYSLSVFCAKTELAAAQATSSPAIVLTVGESLFGVMLGSFMTKDSRVSLHLEE